MSLFAAWSPVMAYVLGYWFADGNIDHQPGAGGYTVSIGSKDLAHLELLRATIGLGRLTRITGSDVYKLVICRKAMFEELLRLGGSERKSLTLTWPAVPDGYLPHFVRGYVDGDGCLSWHKAGSSVHPLLDVTGSRHFVAGLATSVCENTGIPIPTIHQHGGVYRAKWYGITVKCLAAWLYHQHPGLALERKAKLAAESIAWQPKLFRERRVTPRMWELFGEHLP